MKKYCTVFGGGGFIGSVLCKVLIENGRNVRIVDIKDESDVFIHESIDYIKGDYSDSVILEKCLIDTDEIIDLAYATYPQTSFENPVFDITQNLPASVNLLETISRHDIKKIIFVSSGGTVYGEPEYLPIDENHPTNPISPYGITKLAIEKYFGMFYRLKGVPFICVRPANPYGAGQMAYRGQGFIATAIKSVIENKEIVIYGSRGTIRDYIHIDDLAAGIFSALENGKVGEVYNIGTGKGADNMDIIAILQDLAIKEGIQLKFKNIDARLFDVSANILASEKLYKDSGWKSKVDLKYGIEELWSCLFKSHSAK
jgi:UDP-glucose 4-epimerase